MEFNNNPNESNLNKIYALLNSAFRSSFSPTMQYEFRNLFRKGNLNHVYFASEGDEIASHLAYNTVELVTGGEVYKIAFLGAVATSEKFRKRGIATTLLKMAENSMIGENVDLCIISGDLPIYKDNGYESFGKSFRFNIRESENRFEMKPYSNRDFFCVQRIYGEEKIRFNRSESDFKELIETYETVKRIGESSLKIAQIGQTYLSEENDIYFTLRGNFSSVLEYSGNREAVLTALEMNCHENHRELRLDVPENDHEFLQALEKRGYSCSEQFSLPPFHTMKDFSSRGIPQIPLPGLNFV